MSGNALKAGWLWDDLQTASQRVKTFSSEGRGVHSLSSPLRSDDQQPESQQSDDGHTQRPPKK